MKDRWRIQQLHAAASEFIVTDSSVEEVKPDSVCLRRRNPKCIEEIMIPMNSGDVLMLTYHCEGRVSACIFKHQSGLRRGREIQGTDLPKEVEFVNAISECVFLTIDNNESQEVQTLRAHNAGTQEKGRNRLRFRKEGICCMAAINSGFNETLVVLGDIDGNLYLVRYRDGHLKMFKEINSKQEQGIFSVGGMDNRFWAVFNDGHAIVWNAVTCERIGYIENSELVQISMSGGCLITSCEGVLRLYSEDDRLKLKSIAHMPVRNSNLLFHAFSPLTSTIGMVHDEDYNIVFFDMTTGTPISSVKTPFKTLFSLHILPDATLLISSEMAVEGHAILTITKPDIVHKALLQRANYCYTNPLAMKKIRKPGEWAQWPLMGLLTVAFLKIGCKLLQGKG